MTTDSTRSAIGDRIAAIIQTISVVAGVVISILSFNDARSKDAIARSAEAAWPFLEMRQKLYLDAAHTTAMMTNLDNYSDQEAKQARQRFRELYVTELSLVEDGRVETGMKNLAKEVDKELLEFTDAQNAAYELSHALRDSLRKSWGFAPAIVDNPN